MQAAKQLLRNEIREKLKLISKETKEAESLIVLQKLVNMKEYKQSNNISVYLSMSGEVDTSHLVKRIFSDGKNCYVPVIDKKRREMEMIKLDSFDEYLSLPSNSWGIKEPPKVELIPNEKIALQNEIGFDLIVSPGLCFDKEGWRLGHGKGYYDKYLSRCFLYSQENSLKKPFVVALALNAQIIDKSVPRESFDIKPDLVLHA